MGSLTQLKNDLQALQRPKKAAFLAGFFKTGPGEYAEGDVFLGITVPEQRKVAKKYRDLPLSDIKILLQNKIHEYRLTALLILVDRYQRTDIPEEILDFYLKNIRHVNNWDLVDLSAPKILGDYLLRHDRAVLHRLVKSNDLWERRIAMVATYPLIKAGEFTEALAMAEALRDDSHDLIHKAVGWMLREVGKLDRKVLEAFLHKHYQLMPRTMLRYAIEKLPEARRQAYLKGRI